MRKAIDLLYIILPGFIPNFLLLVGFILVDNIWLRSLPKWGVSFGSGGVTAFILSALRVGFYVAWLILQVALHQIGKDSLTLSLWIFFIPNLLLLGLSLYGFIIEPFHLTESHLEIQVPGLPEPKRIIQLSDIHIERLSRRERSLVEKVGDLRPDMIVVTGDSMNESYITETQARADFNTLMSQFSAPLGVYLVNGNVLSPAALEWRLQGLDTQVLVNQAVRVPEFGPHFVLLGLAYTGRGDAEELQTLMAETQPDDFTLLLYHKPDLIYDAADMGVDLYLAGHTHGGQVRVPFYGALFTNSRYGKDFEMGLYHVQDTTLYVSRGIGFTGGPAPRIRLFAPPEIVIIDLIPG